MDFTCVEIKNVKYIKLIPLDRKCERALDLTTLHKDQELAYLNIFHVGKDMKKTLLKSIQINNIRPGNSGIPELKLSVSYDGTQYYKIVLKLNGYIYHNSVIDIKQVGKPSFNILNLALIALVILVIAFLGYFSFRSLLNNRESNPLNQSSENLEQEQGREIDPTTRVLSESSSNSINVTELNYSDSSSTDSSSTDSSSIDSSSTDSSSTDSSSTDSSSTDSSSIDSSSIDSSSTDSSSTDSSSTDSSSIEPQTIETSELIDNKAIVYFYPNSSVLTEDAKSILRKILDILNNNSNLDVEILGHCAFFGTEKGRQEISTERAESVYSFFIKNGWTPESQALLIGLGHQNIVTRDPEKQNLNRRVEIRIESKKEN